MELQNYTHTGYAKITEMPITCIYAMEFYLIMNQKEEVKHL